MNKFVIFSVVIALVVALQGAQAKPKAKAGGASPSAKSDIDELAGNARQLVQNVSAIIDGSLPDSKQVSDSLTQTTQQLATKFKEVIDNLNKQAQEHKGDVETAVNKFKENLSSVATKLEESVGPDTVKKAKEIKANVDEGLNKAIAQAQDLAKSVEPEATKVKEDLTKAAKNVLDQIVEMSKKLKSELDKNVAKS